jgi:hypothetical protein
MKEKQSMLPFVLHIRRGTGDIAKKAQKISEKTINIAIRFKCRLQLKSALFI